MMSIRMASGRVIAIRVKPKGRPSSNTRCDELRGLCPRSSGMGKHSKWILIRRSPNADGPRRPSGIEPARHKRRMATLRSALGLLAVGWAALAIGLLADLPRGGPERTIVGYLEDLEGRRVDAALAALRPEDRPGWR